MTSSAPEAILQFNKWIQEKAHLRLIITLNSVSLSVLSSGLASTVGLDEVGRFTAELGDLEINFLVDDAEFEYQDPREANLASIGLSFDNCVCCWTITFRDPFRKSGAALPDAALMICELRR